jgi:hypothetical protein
MTTTEIELGPVVLDYQRAKALLLAQVEKLGADHTYLRNEDNTCSYFKRNGRPDCIVGHILSDLGFKLKDLNKLQANVGTGVYQVFPDLGIIDADDRALDLLAYAQGEQDAGKTWGESVELAITVVEP